MKVKQESKIVFLSELNLKVNDHFLSGNIYFNILK